MSEVKRYQADWHGMFLDLPGRRMGTEERLVVLASDFDRVTAERDAALERVRGLKEKLDNWIEKSDQLQQRLTAADERTDVLEGLFRRVVESSVLSFEQDAPEELESLEADICAALKPAEGGADEA